MPVDSKTQSPEAQAALSKFKEDPFRETVLTGLAGVAALGPTILNASQKRGPLAAVAIATAGAVGGGTLGHVAAKVMNKHFDTIASTTDATERNAALQKEKYSEKLSTFGGAAGGGLAGGMIGYVAAESSKVKGGGKFAIIAGATTLGAVTIGAINQHVARKRNANVDALADALNKQQGFTETLEQQRQTAAQAPAGAKLG